MRSSAADDLILPVEKPFLTVQKDVPLAPDEARRLNEAHRLMKGGRLQEALAFAEAVLKNKPRQADALHLKGLILAAAGRTDDAISVLEEAARQRPRAAGLWAALGEVAYDAERLDRARAAFREASALDPRNGIIWHWRGNVAQSEGDFSEAVDAFSKAVALDASNRAAWINLANAYKRLGNTERAGTCLDRADRLGPTRPEILDLRAAMTAERGHTAEALEQYTRLTDGFPAYLPGHDARAKLLWENFPERAPEEGLVAALKTMPENLGLHFSYIRLLLGMKRHGEARAALFAARKIRELPQFLATEASILDAEGDGDAAVRLYEAAAERAPQDFSIRGHFARQLLKMREAERAARVAEETLARRPDDQLAWAYLGTAWRLLDDPREYWLNDYDRLIGAADLENENGLLEEAERTLAGLHKGVRQPLDQTVRGGTQTPGYLFSGNDPVLTRLRDALMAAAAAYVSKLPDDPGHPFLRRKRPKMRFYGAWSVRLASSGFHVNHVHPEGWLSSACYIALPPDLTEAGTHAGWIQFGVPQDDLGLDLPPRKRIEPKPGRLALFPSYMWHGTVPFESETPRLTAVFDALPA